MSKKCISRLIKGVSLSILLYSAPAGAQWPTFDIAAVFNTIKTTGSQVQSEVSTAQETLAKINIQQAIGDNLGGLTKFKNPLKEAEKEAKRAEKAKKYLSQLQKMRERYNEVKDDVTEAYGEARDKYNEAKDAYNDAKNTAEGMYNQAQDAYGQAQNMYNEAQNTAQGIYNQAQDAYGQAQNMYNGAQNAMNATNTENASGSNSEGMPNNLSSMTNTPNSGGVSLSNQDDKSGFGRGLEESSDFDYKGDSNKGTSSSDDLWVEDEEVVSEDVLPQRGLTLENPSEFSAEEDFEADEDILPVKGKDSKTRGDAFETLEDDLFATGDEPIEKFSVNSTITTVAPTTGSQPATEQAPAAKNVGPKAFGKVSYRMHTSFGFAQQVKTCAYTGLNKDGNRVLPDTLASLCCIDVSNENLEIDEDLAMKCVNQICDMMNESDNGKRQDYMKEINRARKEVILSAFSAANEMKQKYSSISKTEDELDNIKDKSSGDVSTQLSGNAELTNADANTQKDLLLIKASALEMDALEAMFNYCQNYARASDGD